MTTKLERFLNLQDFDEYIRYYESFCGLEKGTATLKKEMQLMEGDTCYTHREKERIVERKKREILKRLHAEIDALRDAEGDIWTEPEGDEPEIEFRYLYPNDKRGDIEHYLTGLYYEPAEKGDGIFSVRIASSDYKLIELLVLPVKNLFTHYNFTQSDPAMIFLIRHNRIAQIENLMSRVNYYRFEYKSLRTIPDLKLKRLLQDYHGELNRKRDEIYQELIGEGLTNPKWVSEQKAYAIVKEFFPDAVFQYQPDFLFGQRIDIFIPSVKTAIEYQGKQHYEAVEFFGGANGLKDNQRRDARKRRRCRAEGIQVIYWNYDEPLTREFFQEKLLVEIIGNGLA